MEVTSPRKPRRKPRRSRVTDREKGLDVVVRDGLFVLPMDAAKAGPVTYWINRLSVNVYNRTADLMTVKAQLEVAMHGAEGAELDDLKDSVTIVNKLIKPLRTQGFRLRQYVLNVECSQHINEPLNWARE